MINQEKKYIEKIEQSIDNKIVQERIKYLLIWYSHKATINKYLYFAFVAISIIAPALITLINSCVKDSFLGMNKTCLISLISTIATIFAGILAITRWQEGWLRYRKTAELIKSKVSIYLIKRKNSENDDNKKIDNEFISEIEDIVQKENAEWLSMRRDELTKENQELGKNSQK